MCALCAFEHPHFELFPNRDGMFFMIICFLHFRRDTHLNSAPRGQADKELLSFQTTFLWQRLIVHDDCAWFVDKEHKCYVPYICLFTPILHQLKYEQQKP